MVPAGFGDHPLVQGPQFSNSRAHISGFVGFSETLPRPSLSLTCGSSPWAFWHLSSLPQADSFVRCGRRTFTSYINLLPAPRHTHYQPQHLQKGAAPLYICLRCSPPSVLLGPGWTLSLPWHCLSFCPAASKDFYGAAVIVSLLLCLQR